MEQLKYKFCDICDRPAGSSVLVEYQEKENPFLIKPAHRTCLEDYTLCCICKRYFKSDINSERCQPCRALPGQNYPDY